MGTATVQGAAIYLPPSYGLDHERRYPVIYLPHGIFDRYQGWLEGFLWSDSLTESMNSMRWVEGE